MSQSTSSSRLPTIESSAAARRRTQEASRREFAAHQQKSQLALSLLAGAGVLAGALYAAANSSQDLAAISAVAQALGSHGAGLLGGLLIGGALYHLDRVIQDRPEEVL